MTSQLKKLKLSIFIAIFASMTPPTMAAELHLDYVANAGVKLSFGDKTVLIDALFPPHDFFKSQTDEEFKALSEEGADIILSTHDHSDHFGAKRTATFLNENPNAFFIGTPSMLEHIGDRANSSQLTTVKSPDFVASTFTHSGIKVTALNFPHMAPRPGQAVNFGFIVELGGWRVLHVGDADVNGEIIDHLELSKRNIDVAIIHDLFPSQHENYQELLDRIGAEKIVFVHMVDDKAEPMAKWLKENMPEGDMLVTGYEHILLQK